MTRRLGSTLAAALILVGCGDEATGPPPGDTGPVYVPSETPGQLLANLETALRTGDVDTYRTFLAPGYRYRVVTGEGEAVAELDADAEIAALTDWSALAKALGDVGEPAPAEVRDVAVTLRDLLASPSGDPGYPYEEGYLQVSVGTAEVSIEVRVAGDTWTLGRNDSSVRIVVRENGDGSYLVHAQRSTAGGGWATLRGYGSR